MLQRLSMQFSIFVLSSFESEKWPLWLIGKGALIEQIKSSREYLILFSVFGHLKQFFPMFEAYSMQDTRIPSSPTCI